MGDASSSVSKRSDRGWAYSTFNIVNRPADISTCTSTSKNYIFKKHLAAAAARMEGELEVY